MDLWLWNTHHCKIKDRARSTALQDITFNGNYRTRMPREEAMSGSKSDILEDVCGWRRGQGLGQGVAMERWGRHMHSSIEYVANILSLFLFISLSFTLRESERRNSAFFSSTCYLHAMIVNCRSAADDRNQTNGQTTCRRQRKGHAVLGTCT